MKKIIVLIVIALAFTAGNAFATSAAATGVTDTDAQEVLGNDTSSGAQALICKASKGVKVAWNTAGTGYSLSTYHNSGTKAYGAAYDTTVLYYNDVGEGHTLAAPTDSAGDVAFSGWQEL